MTRYEGMTDDELSREVWMRLPEIPPPWQELVEELLDRFHAYLDAEEQDSRA